MQSFIDTFDFMKDGVLIHGSVVFLVLVPHEWLAHILNDCHVHYGGHFREVGDDVFDAHQAEQFGIGGGAADGQDADGAVLDADFLVGGIQKTNGQLANGRCVELI